MKRYLVPLCCGGLLCLLVVGCTSSPQETAVASTPPPPTAYPGEGDSLLSESLAFLEARMADQKAEAQARYGFEDTASPEELAQVGERIQRDFSDWLGVSASPVRFEELETIEIPSPESYSLQYVRFKNANGLIVRGLLSVPQNDAASHPVVMIPNGSSASPYQLFGIPERDYHNAVAARFAETYIVFAIDIPDLANETFLFSNVVGMNWLYYQTCDRITPALDFALTQSGADESRIAIYGISLGGWAAITGAACDARIATAAASGTNVFTSLFTQITSNRRFRYPSYYLYDVINRPDFYQVMYGLFPRPVIIELDDKDTTGVYEEAFSNANTILRYYALRGQPDSAHLLLITDDTCAFANQHHCMEVTRVKAIFDELFGEEA